MPSRLDRDVITLGVQRASTALRDALGDGGRTLVVDETQSSPGALKRLAEDFGIAVAPGWDAGYLDGVQRIDVETSDEFQALGARHLADTLVGWTAASDRVLLIVNPATGSPAMRDAHERGVEVFALLHRRTSLPADSGTIVPWRRSGDLAPLLFAAKPADARTWSAEYQHFRQLNSTTPKNTIKEHGPDAGTEPLEQRGSEPPRHRGGFVTLASFIQTPIDAESRVHRLGIPVSRIGDPEAWVIGGRSIAPDRAIQVVRNGKPYGFDVQLVWGGRDPRPNELLDVEDHVTTALATTGTEPPRTELSSDSWVLLSDESLITRGEKPETVLSAGDGQTTVNVRRTDDDGWSLRIDSDRVGAVRIAVRFFSARVHPMDVLLTGDPVREYVSGAPDDPPVAVRVDA